VTAPRALLTAFEPFRVWSVNSSGEAAKALAAERRGLRAAILPVCHEAAPRALDAALDADPPDLLLLTGLADDGAPRLERRARRPEGVAPGPAVLAGVWPWAASLDALRAAGCPAFVSDDPGRYVCETVYWHALDRRARGAAPTLVAFLHVPPLSDDWPVARVAAAVGATLDAGRAALGAHAASHPRALGSL
jgi:pyroglutamyl-peptidase